MGDNKLTCKSLSNSSNLSCNSGLRSLAIAATQISCDQKHEWEAARDAAEDVRERLPRLCCCCRHIQVGATSRDVVCARFSNLQNGGEWSVGENLAARGSFCRIFRLVLVLECRGTASQSPSCSLEFFVIKTLYLNKNFPIPISSSSSSTSDLNSLPSTECHNYRLHLGANSGPPTATASASSSLSQPPMAAKASRGL